MISDVKAKPSGSQQNPLFKWVKESTGPSQSLEQKQFELPGQMKSTAQSSKLAPSSPAFGYTHKGAQDGISSSNVSSFGATHTVPKSNTLTFKTTITPKSNANTEAPSMATAKAPQSPLSVKTLTGESGDLSTLTMKNRQDNQAMPSLGNIKGLGPSPQSKGDMFRDLSKSSFTSENSKPAVLHEKSGQLNGVSDAVHNTVKETPKVASQPPAFSPVSVTQTNLYSIKPTVSSSATSSSSVMQASAAKTSDILSSSVQKSTPKVSSLVTGDNLSSSVPSIPTPVKDLSSGLCKNAAKPETVTSEVTSTIVSASSSVISTTEGKPSPPPTTGSSLPSTPVSAPKTAPTTAESAVTSTGKDVGPNNISTDEDDMEEEVPSASAELNLGALCGFGLGSQPSSSPQKSNPFGTSFGTSDNKSSGTPFTLTTSPGQLFRPASLSIPSAQPAQPSQSTSSSAFSSTFSSGLTGFGQPAQLGSVQQSGFGKPAQIGAGFGQPAQIQSGFGQPAQIGSGQQSGFGQPAQIGAGQQSGFGQPAQFGVQQALGSVLGSFGQSRQLGGAGSGGFGGFASASTSGGFGSLSSSNAGFAGAAAGGGFPVPAPSAGGGLPAAATGGGFAALASKSGGFAAAASSGGGFAAAASSGGGFAAAASSGGGFGGATQGGGFGSGKISDVLYLILEVLDKC
jgi:nuclear pore complex protein Nup214